MTRTPSVAARSVALPTARTGDSVRAVERALTILKSFTAEQAELSAAQLLDRVDLSRPTMYRLLQTLQASGFLVAIGRPQRFRLGPAVAQLAHAWTSGPDIVEHARPFLARLSEQTGETVSLFVPEGDDRVCVAEFASPQPLSYRRGVGYRAPISVGASGKAILAWQVGGVAGKVVGTAELTRIRAAGYAVSFGELIQGAVALAAPCFDATGAVVGAVAVFGPATRLPRARVAIIAKQLMVEAAAISSALGRR